MVTRGQKLSLGLAAPQLSACQISCNHLPAFIARPQKFAAEAHVAPINLDGQGERPIGVQTVFCQTSLLLLQMYSQPPTLKTEQARALSQIVILARNI
jgi:hypothetical protein